MSVTLSSGLEVRELMGPVRVAAASAAVVVRGMEAALPSDATPEERAALARAVAAGEEVQESLLEREQSPARVRPAYMSLVMMWSIFADMLGALARIPAEVSPRGPRAAALLREVLPDGTAFAQLEAGQAWAGAVRRLKHIDENGLAPQIDELVGADVLPGVRQATDGLRVALGAGPTPSDSLSSTAVAEKTATFSRLLGIYCRVLGSKLDEADATSVERFRKAVAPLLEYRSSRRGQDDTDDVTPVSTQPVAVGMPGGSPFMAEPRS